MVKNYSFVVDIEINDPVAQLICNEAMLKDVDAMNDAVRRAALQWILENYDSENEFMIDVASKILRKQDEVVVTESDNWIEHDGSVVDVAPNWKLPVGVNPSDIVEVKLRGFETCKGAPAEAHFYRWTPSPAHLGTRSCDIIAYKKVNVS